MALMGGAQLILQTQELSGVFDCHGYIGLPVINPLMIVLASADTPTARSDLAELHREIQVRLSGMSQNLQTVALPCHGSLVDPLVCHAHLDPQCQKLLVLVGDDTQPLPLDQLSQYWLAADSNYSILPVYRISARGSVSGLLPPELQHLNVEFWSSSIAQTVPVVFGRANLTTENPRIFISYRQKDSSALAIQLFDALSHEGFDVFLDHFRIPPGVNFQSRLTQELGDKSMVLLIESTDILNSPWTLYEINVAKTCSLGLLGLRVPGGPSVPGIDDDIREEVQDADFTHGIFSQAAELTDGALIKVVDRVKQEHDRTLVRRRQILRDSLEGALLEQGVMAPALTSSGVMRIQSPSSGKEYIVWLTPRPPELPDFHVVHGQTVPPATGVVVGLSRLMEPLRLAQTGWLAGLCQIEMVDEGHLRVAAAAIAQGLL